MPLSLAARPWAGVGALLALGATVLILWIIVVRIGEASNPGPGFDDPDAEFLDDDDAGPKQEQEPGNKARL